MPGFNNYPNKDGDDDENENDDALAFKVGHWQVCEISELTADVVHATAVKHIADEDDGDGDIDDDGDSDAGVGETRLTSCNFFYFVT